MVLLLCLIYLGLVVLGITLLSPLPIALLALVLAGGHLLDYFRPLRAGTRVMVAAAGCFLFPVILAPALGSLSPGFPAIGLALAAVAMTLPTGYLFDQALRRIAPHLAPVVTGEGRQLTSLAWRLVASAMLLLAAALVFDNLPLTFASLLFSAYLLARLIPAYLSAGRRPLAVSGVTRRVIASSREEVSLHLQDASRAELYTYLRPLQPWVKVNPAQLTTLNGKPALFSLRLSPPLAGPSRVSIQASSLDASGLLQTDRILHPVTLQVIPRARYAEWLARKYLEQSGSGAGGATTPWKGLPVRRGLEYYQSRDYQPGDHLRYLDWKHSLKLDKLIVKEHLETGIPAAVLAVNLTAGNAEEADELAYRLITSALTLAEAGVPAALAAYNHREVVQASPPGDPRDVLKQSLSLVKNITVEDMPPRSLEAADFGRLRRNITGLGKTDSGPSRKLLELLQLEYRAVENAARSHPLTSALQAVTRRNPLPATILLVSLLNHDADAAAFHSARPSASYTVIRVEADREMTDRKPASAMATS